MGQCTYDADGNTLSLPTWIPPSFGTKPFIATYDTEGHLTSYFNSDRGLNLTFGYRPDGLLAWRHDPNTGDGGYTTYYFYAGSRLLYTYDPHPLDNPTLPETASLYAWGARGLEEQDQFIPIYNSLAGAFIREEFASAYLYDPQGNLLSSVGVSTFDNPGVGYPPDNLCFFDAYGQYVANVQWANQGSNAGYPGQDSVGWGGEWGALTDIREPALILCTNRFYCPTIGRFLTRDPVGVGGGINLYAYARNNPINHADPSGLDVFDDVWGWFGARAQDAKHAAGSVVRGVGGAISWGATGIFKTFKGICVHGMKMDPKAPTFANPYLDPGTPETYVYNGRLLQGHEIGEYIDRTGGDVVLAMMLHGAGEFSEDFVRLSWARKLSNVEGRIFQMSDAELDFVAAVRNQRPNLQIFRANQKSGLGDFLIVDPSNPQAPVGWFVELKTGGGGAGFQLRNAAAAARSLGLSKFRTLSGTHESVLSALTGRGGW